MTRTQYDELAVLYDEQSATNAASAWYDRPAMLALAGDIAGKAVLDVGCAGGQLTRLLAARGARVTAPDLSPALLELARERCPRSPS